jgi:hypothetical protein
MEAKWTPGKWRNDSAGTDAMVSTGCDSDRAISIDCTRSGASVAEDRANARLIAAAPDLYEALREQLRFVTTFLERDGASAETVDYYTERARAALASATPKAVRA